MTEDFIDYGRLIDDAMRGIVKKALKIVQEKGLEGDHHFFITFQTQHPEVMMSDKLMEKYPEEMTIILQHQFWELEVDDKHFSVVLSFDNVQENLTVPFSALTSFADPSVKFGLQFRRPQFTAKGGKVEKEDKKKASKSAEKSELKAENSNIVTLDSFRKKK